MSAQPCGSGRVMRSSLSLGGVPLLCLVLVLLGVSLQLPSPSLGAVESLSDVLDLYASQSISVPSHRDISAVHVLDAYVVYDAQSDEPLSHFHPMSSPSRFRTMDAAGSGLPSYSHQPSPVAAWGSSGSYQPFPHAVVLAFSAFDVRFRVPLVRVPSLWVSNASVEVRDGWDALVDTAAPLDSTYWALDGDYLDDNWAVATLREDGRFHAVINHEGEVYQADPIDHFRPDMDAQHFHTLATSSQRGMAIYRHRDMHSQHDKRCGTETHEHAKGSRERQVEETDIEWAADAAAEVDVRDAQGHPIVGLNSSRSGSGSSSRRRLLQMAVNDEYPTAANLAGMSIFDIFDTPQRMPYTFVVDAGFYSLFNSVADVQAAVTAVVVASNIILLKQAQIYIQINQITVMTQPNAVGGPNPWNQAAYWPSTHSCPGYDIATQLNDMNDYRQYSHPTQGAAHHLFTNCWPAPGTVGISYIGWTCTAEYAISISSYNAPFWQTVVHEIGHTLGAEHTFATASWAGGGIMDYYVDSRYPIGTGPFQFAPPNEAQMQYWVATDNELQNFATYTQPFCQVDYVAVCGNGVVEPGEACDDNSGCCTSNCSLAAGAQCSGNSTCCSVATCAYAPSSVACGAGHGFCANGLCALSNCPSSLPFCGLDTSTGGCRQSCSGGGLCSSTAWSYNLNLPDGTVCNTQGGTCSAGQCVTPTSTSANALTYAWTSGQWPATCPCSGNETRAVSCVGTSGAGSSSVVADSYCTSTGVARPSTWQTCTIPASCFPYAWQYSAWSACSQSCDGGLSVRTASCYWQSSPPLLVDAAYCSALPGPAATVTACNTANCTYQYVAASTFSACTASCGGGSQTRTTPTTCQRSINGAWQTAPLSSCQAILGYAVNDTQACNVQACDTYSWQYGSWGSCNVSCGGGGVASRSYWCLDVTTGVQAANSACLLRNATLGLPIVSEACGAAACPSYQYVYGNWSACSATCGGGVMTRTAACYDSVYGAWYDLGTCAAVLGSANTTASCNAAACPTWTYEWQWSAWGACPVVCGGGNQTRQVACVSLTPVYLPAASSNCPASTKPVAYQACGQKSCNIYSWSVAGWSNCSAACGGGTQTRAVYCQNFWTGALTDPSTCTQYMSSPQPSTSQTCNAQACHAAVDPIPIVASNVSADGWIVGQWGQCSAQCGGGWQYRDVQCLDAPSAACATNQSLVAPASTQQCNSQLCPAVWQSGAWSSCSAQCGGGWMNRSSQCVTAVSDDGASVVVVDDSRCAALSRPSGNAECNFAPCPAWTYSEWAPCSASCGLGVSSRLATCSRYDGLALSSSQCSALGLDATSRVCEQQACPHFHTAAWSDCSRPCGTQGSQHRSLTCRLPHNPQYEGEAVAMERCTALLNASAAAIAVDGPSASAEDRMRLLVPLPPVTTRSCNAQACPAYYWLAVPASPSSCSAECGGGEEALDVGCYSGASGERVDDGQCLADARPAPSRLCNVQPCDGPVWVSGGWSQCSAVCGAGRQQRNVSCVVVAAGGGTLAVDDTECEQLWPTTMPATEQACAVPESVCWGMGMDGGDAEVAAGAPVNGVCDTASRSCSCRPGYGGQWCEESPFIGDVRLAALGVVFGDVLWVEWSSSAAIPHVSLSLHRANGSSSWTAVGSYLVQYTANYGEWTWSVPAWLPAASDYYVRVSYSPAVYADSPLLSVTESACGYVECGEHGSCSSASGQCQCAAGWSGPDCSVSPCDTLRCNWAHAEQCNALSWLSSNGSQSQQCACLDGWSGPLCATPPQCSADLVCLNGGDTDLSTVFVDYSGSTEAKYCGRCRCTGRWQGSTCSVCPITCANGGVVDANCTHCSCPAGYYGSACQSRYYELTVQLDLTTMGPGAAQLVLDDTAAVRRLEQDAASELASAAGFASLSGAVSVAVTAAPGQTPSHIALLCRLAYSSVLVASFDVGASLLPSAGLSDAIAGTGGAIAAVSPQLLAPYKQAWALAGGNRAPARSLLSAYTNLTVMLADKDSLLYSGELLSLIDVQLGVQVRDPTGLDQASIDSIPLPLPTSRFVASGPSTSPHSSSTAAAAAPQADTATASRFHPAAVVAAVLVVAGVLIALAAVMGARYRAKLSCLPACPISLPIGAAPTTPQVPPAGCLTASVSAPSSSSFSSSLSFSSSDALSAAAAALARLPSAGELEMVTSANSDMPELDYYQRSISDSSVAYQLHRNASSPEPVGYGFARQGQDDDHEHDDQHLEMQHMRRATSMDELPSPPLLLHSLSSA